MIIGNESAMNSWEIGIWRRVAADNASRAAPVKRDHFSTGRFSPARRMECDKLEFGELIEVIQWKTTMYYLMTGKRDMKVRLTLDEEHIPFV